MSSAGRMNKYETIVVTRTDAGHEAQRKLYERITGEMEKAGVKHVRFELWGKRRLAFPIAKSSKGIYMYYVYLGDGDFPKTLHRTLKLSNIVLRYLTVQIGKGIDPATFDFDKEKQFDALPTESDEFEHGRPTTGWDAEFSRDKAKPEGEDDEDDDEDEEEGEEKPEKSRDEDEDEEE
jgi:small subunit ribosomal protein S6